MSWDIDYITFTLRVSNTKYPNEVHPVGELSLFTDEAAYNNIKAYRKLSQKIVFNELCGGDSVATASPHLPPPHQSLFWRLFV